MNKPSNNIIRKRLARCASSALVLFAAVLALFALTAESSSPAPTPCKTRGECKGWPREDQKIQFAEAFTRALRDSITNHNLRCKLLRSPGSAKTALEAILKDLYPKETLEFPKKAEIRFYEAEEAGTFSTRIDLASNYPEEHCLAIFSLPEEGKVAAAEPPSFRKNLMCCYKPW